MLLCGAGNNGSSVECLLTRDVLIRLLSSRCYLPETLQYSLTEQIVNQGCLFLQNSHG